MLAANVIVAEHLESKFNGRAVVRVHPELEKEKKEELKKFYLKNGLGDIDLQDST